MRCLHVVKKICDVNTATLAIVYIRAQESNRALNIAASSDSGWLPVEGQHAISALRCHSTVRPFHNCYCSMSLQVNGEYFGHGTLSMNLDPSQHHHLHSHHNTMAGMQMPLNPGDDMM